MATQSRAQLEALMGIASPGLVYGFHAPDPGAADLDWVYSESLVRIAHNVSNPEGFTEFVLDSGTETVTASRDTYAYVHGTTGVLTFVAVTNGADKPVIGGSGTSDIVDNSLFLAKCVSDATDITSITDLRQFTGNIQTHAIPVGFETADLGVHKWVPRVHARVIGLDSRVINALAAANAGTVIPYTIDMGGTATEVTNATISHAASADPGVRDLEISDGFFYINEMDEIDLESAKETVGGCCMVTVVLEIL